MRHPCAHRFRALSLVDLAPSAPLDPPPWDREHSVGVISVERGFWASRHTRKVVFLSLNEIDEDGEDVGTHATHTHVPGLERLNPAADDTQQERG